ncbi:MAG: hypothetical protein JST06_04095 [Bacteroidetes bacterium]|nr:hypothetical protein [Bacteroidota bacterium]
MKALQKSIRISLAALLLLALPLLGHMHACGLAGLSGRVSVHQEKIESSSGPQQSAPITLEAASPGFIYLHKSKQSDAGQKQALHSPGLPGRSVLLLASSEQSLKHLQQLLRTDFTPVQRLMLFPHHGFW